MQRGAGESFFFARKVGGLCDDASSVCGQLAAPRECRIPARRRVVPVLPFAFVFAPRWEVRKAWRPRFKAAGVSASLAGACVGPGLAPWPGGGEAAWDVRNRNNQLVASGVYFYHVETANGLAKIGRLTVVNSSNIVVRQDQ